MPDRAPPRVFVSYARDSDDHVDRVHQLAEFLRTQAGVDAHLDLWYEDRRRDWSIWAAEHLAEADFVLVVASPRYKHDAEGTTAQNEDSRAQLQAAILRDNLARNLRDSTERILPVVLPGRSVRDIPAFLTPHSATSYRVDELTAAGIAGLLAAITGEGQYPLPELGSWQGGVVERPAARLLARMRWAARSPDLRAGTAKISGVAYEDSIVVQRPSTADAPVFVEVRLDRAYRRITATVGVLDDASEPFQVGDFVIMLDDVPRWHRKAALGKPAAVDLDVTGARTVRMEMSRGVSGRLSELAWGTPALS